MAEIAISRTAFRVGAVELAGGDNPHHRPARAVRALPLRRAARRPRREIAARLREMPQRCASPITISANYLGELSRRFLTSVPPTPITSASSAGFSIVPNPGPEFPAPDMIVMPAAATSRTCESIQLHYLADVGGIYSGCGLAHLREHSTLRYLADGGGIIGRVWECGAAGSRAFSTNGASRKSRPPYLTLPTYSYLTYLLHERRVAEVGPSDRQVDQVDVLLERVVKRL